MPVACDGCEFRVVEGCIAFKAYVGESGLLLFTGIWVCYVLLSLLACVFTSTARMNVPDRTISS